MSEMNMFGIEKYLRRKMKQEVRSSVEEGGGEGSSKLPGRSQRSSGKVLLELKTRSKQGNKV